MFTRERLRLADPRQIPVSILVPNPADAASINGAEVDGQRRKHRAIHDGARAGARAKRAHARGRARILRPRPPPRRLMKTLASVQGDFQDYLLRAGTAVQPPRQVALQSGHAGGVGSCASTRYTG